MIIRDKTAKQFNKDIQKILKTLHHIEDVTDYKNIPLGRAINWLQKTKIINPLYE